MESLEVNPCIHDHLIFDKPAKNAQWRKDCLFNKWSGQNWIFTLRKMKLDSTHTSHSSTVLAISIIECYQLWSPYFILDPQALLILLTSSYFPTSPTKPLESTFLYFREFDLPSLAPTTLVSTYK